MNAMHQEQFLRNPARSIARAAIASVLARLDRDQSAEMHAAKNWQFDPDVPLILRASTTPHDMSNAAALVQVAAAVLPMLTPYSAAAALFANSLSLTLTRDAGGFTVPGFGVGNVAFVAEGAAKPVVQGVSSGGRIDPHKIAGIAVVSSELFAQPSIETIMQTFLAESAGPALDLAAFSTAGATPDHPAGLLNGLTPVTTGADMNADLVALGSAIAPVAGAGKIALVMNVAQYIAFAFRTYRELDNVIAIPSGTVPAGTVIAIATNAIVSAMGVPEFETNTQATLHMSNTPLPIVGPGVAMPVSSMFQTASVAIKMVMPASWAMRSPQGVAYMTGVTW